MPLWITWKHTLDENPLPWTLDKKIEIFYARFYGWQLNIANTMANGGTYEKTKEPYKPLPDSDFATLSVCMSYFEMIGKYQAGYIKNKGRGNSTKYFIEGIKTVLPEIKTWPDNVLVELYHRVRCGLYHVAITGPKVFVTSEDFIIACDDEKIAINPHILPKILLKHLEEYRDQLMDTSNDELRKKFEKRFDLDNGLS